MCKKKKQAFLLFFKPRGWIRHKTPDGFIMFFCGLTCFRKFTGVKLARRPAPVEKRYEVVEEEKEQLVAVPAQ